jgi:acetoin utilization deacetylase AcuC-like enzyme
MLKAESKTGLVFFPAFDWAIDPTHPEREERLLYTQDQVFEEGIFDIDGIKEFKPGLTTEKDIQRVHFCAPNVASVTTNSHFISVGGAQTIGKAVMEKEVDRGFALVRPPGHHAMRVVHGARGFCNVNVEAIMIEHIRQTYGVRKVAIVDTDCHHGDGTQDIYWHDPETLFISLHQDGRTLYPGSGFVQDMGGPTAIGTTINLPLPPHTGESGILFAMREIVMPILKDFQPEIIINSAGQDNHFSDPITNMNFTAHGYAELTTLLKPDIAVLEGGYSIEGALPYINLGIILSLAGMDYSRVIEPNYAPEKLHQPKEIDTYIKSLREITLENWQNRRSLHEDSLNGDEFVERTKHIYYDTDNITENQNEIIRVCPDCSGVFKIDSYSDRGNRILAVHVPRNACDICSAIGREWYDSADLKKYHQTFLQDRPNDAFSSR